VIVGGFIVGVGETIGVGLTDSIGVSPDPLCLGVKNGLVHPVSKIKKLKSNRTPVINA
jgi:hypothetical protein